MRLKSKIILLLLLFTTAATAQQYSLRLAYGRESDSDLGQILSLQNPGAHTYDFDVVSIDGGYLLASSIFDIPLDLYCKGGAALFRSEDLSRYKNLQRVQDLSQKDIYELTFYLKLYYNIDFKKNRIRIGFGEGGSYLSDYLQPEVIEERTESPTNPKYSKFLNYLDISADIDIGRVFKLQSLYDTYLGYTLKHRSGIGGLINGVSGGSNYNTISIERNF